MLHIYPAVTGHRQTLAIGRSAHFLLRLLLCAWKNMHVLSYDQVSSNPMFLKVSINSCPLKLLLVWSHRGEIIIVKRFIQRCNNWPGRTLWIRVVVKLTLSLIWPRYRLFWPRYRLFWPRYIKKRLMRLSCFWVGSHYVTEIHPEFYII